MGAATAMLAALAAGAMGLGPHRVRVERLLPRDAFGIDVAQPLISWELTQPTAVGALSPVVSEVMVAVGTTPAAVAASTAAYTAGVKGGVGSARTHEHRLAVSKHQQHRAFEAVR